ncbi:MAG: hypothetical protein WBD79_09855, partial [Anaerolineae bacterium]
MPPIESNNIIQSHVPKLGLVGLRNPQHVYEKYTQNSISPKTGIADNVSISKESLTDWERFDALQDEDIDLSDAPEITPELFAKAVVR